jgi:hypothetical protein
MDYRWSKNLYDRDGDEYEDCLLVFIGDNAIIKFTDSVELEQFANSILGSLKEIRETP